VSYEWDYGDGDRESGITQSHDFTAAGDYQVTLTVTDDSGLKASRTRVISVQ
jgi:PKD repeat protein